MARTHKRQLTDKNAGRTIKSVQVRPEVWKIAKVLAARLELTLGDVIEVALTRLNDDKTVTKHARPELGS